MFHGRVTAAAHKRPRSFCQKCRWQITAEQAYTADGLGSLCSPCMALEAIRETSSHATRNGKLVHSSRTSLSHCGVILGFKEWNWCKRADLHLLPLTHLLTLPPLPQKKKRRKKCRRALIGRTPPNDPRL